MRIEIATVVMDTSSNHKVITRKTFHGTVVNQGEYEF